MWISRKEYEKNIREVSGNTANYYRAMLTERENRIEGLRRDIQHLLSQRVPPRLRENWLREKSINMPWGLILQQNEEILRLKKENEALHKAIALRPEPPAPSYEFDIQITEPYRGIPAPQQTTPRYPIGSSVLYYDTSGNHSVPRIQIGKVKSSFAHCNLEKDPVVTRFYVVEFFGVEDMTHGMPYRVEPLKGEMIIEESKLYPLE